MSTTKFTFTWERACAKARGLRSVTGLTTAVLSLSEVGLFSVAYRDEVEAFGLEDLISEVFEVEDDDVETALVW